MIASCRSFLRRAGLAGGALLLPAGLHVVTRRGPMPDRRRTDHYVILYLLVGGWDLMLVTDPVIRDGFHAPFDAADVVVAGGARLGPAMGPLLPFMDRLAILKGITVDALNHPQARTQMVTGRFQDPGGPVRSSIQSLLARRTGDAYSIPNLSSDQLRPASFLGEGEDARFEPLRVATLDQLSHLASTGVPTTHDAVSRAVVTLDRVNIERQRHPLPGRLSSSSTVAHGLLAGDEPRRIAASSSLLDEARTFLNVGGRVEQQVRLAVEAIRCDVAPVITVGTGEFDAHTGHDSAGHPAAVERALRAVGDIARGLRATVLPDGRTLLDLTTIVVTNEFSRTPSLNELGGKHHWPGNAMLFIGKGVRARRDGAPHVVGAVDEHLMPLRVNPETGRTDRGAEPIQMRHGLASLLAMVGEDPLPLLGVEPLTSLLA